MTVNPFEGLLPVKHGPTVSPGFLVSRFPPPAIPPLVQHPLPTYTTQPAIHLFESAEVELLDSPDFSEAILGAWQVLGQKIPLLTRLSNHLTETLKSSDFGNKRPPRFRMAGTMALWQLLLLRGALARPVALRVGEAQGVGWLGLQLVYRHPGCACGC